MTPPAPARLHVLLASENDFALIIRRGPTKQVCTLGWNRAKDTFELGQWLKGRIDQADLSPDGRHFLYQASKFSLPDNRLKSYTVLSRAPYLKELHFWSPKKWTYGGGFLDNERFWVVTSDGTPEVRRLPNFARIENASESGLPSWGNIPDRLRRRNGWLPFDDHYQRRVIWSKTLGDWTLSLLVPNRREPQPDFYELRHSPTGVVVASGEWDWADFDAPRKRLCLARDGQLWTLNLKPNATQTLIHDFNSMAFEPIAAPY